LRLAWFVFSSQALAAEVFHLEGQVAPT